MRVSVFILTFALALAGCEEAPWGNMPHRGIKKVKLTAPEPKDSPSYLSEVFLQFSSLIEIDAKKTMLSRLEKLKIDDPKKWFADHFPPEVAQRLAADYDADWDDFYKNTPPKLEKTLGKLRAIAQGEKFEKPRSRSAHAEQNFALEVMTTPAALYTIKIGNGMRDQIFSLSSFAFIDGDMRFVGYLRAALNIDAALPLAATHQGRIDGLSASSPPPCLSESSAFAVTGSGDLVRRPLDAPSSKQASIVPNAEAFACADSAVLFAVNGQLWRWSPEETAPAMITTRNDAAKNTPLALRAHGDDSALLEFGPRSWRFVPISGEGTPPIASQSLPVVAELSRDGQLAAISFDGASASLWARGEALPSIDLVGLKPGEVLSAFAFSSDHRWVVGGTTAGAFHLWGTASGRIQEGAPPLHEGAAITALYPSKNGDFIALGDARGHVWLWDRVNARALIEVSASEKPIVALRIDEANKKLISIDRAGVITRWELTPILK